MSQIKHFKISYGHYSKSILKYFGKSAQIMSFFYLTI